MALAQAEPRAPGGESVPWTLDFLYSDSMGFYSDLMAFNSDLMAFYSDLI